MSFSIYSTFNQSIQLLSKLLVTLFHFPQIIYYQKLGTYLLLIISLFFCLSFCRKKHFIFFYSLFYLYIFKLSFFSTSLPIETAFYFLSKCFYNLLSDFLQIIPFNIWWWSIYHSFLLFKTIYCGFFFC